MATRNNRTNPTAGLEGIIHLVYNPVKDEFHTLIKCPISSKCQTTYYQVGPWKNHLKTKHRALWDKALARSRRLLSEDGPSSTSPAATPGNGDQVQTVGQTTAPPDVGTLRGQGTDTPHNPYVDENGANIDFIDADLMDWLKSPNNMGYLNGLQSNSPNNEGSAMTTDGAPMDPLDAPFPAMNWNFSL